jgi:hypothetical protein
MPNAVLVSTNANVATENAKFRLEYQVVGGGRGNFDWAPTFGDSTAELTAALYVVIKATILARHGLTVLDDEITLLGAITTTQA